MITKRSLFTATSIFILWMCIPGFYLPVKACNPAPEGNHPDQISELEATARKLVDESSSILVADVISAVSRGDAATGLIVTDYTVQVNETLKGDLISEVQFTLEGGELGGLILEISDLPRLTLDQEYMLFMTGTGLTRAAKTAIQSTAKAVVTDLDDTELVDLVREILSDEKGVTR